MRVAMISYNTFVRGRANGWQRQGDNHVLLLQNETGSTWGVDQFAGVADDCEDQVVSLWSQLTAELETLDKVIFCVGSNGAERVIQLAAKNGLTPDRAIFVFCDCNMRRKEDLIRMRGFETSRIIMYDCGGHEAMFRIYDHFLTFGDIPN